MLIIKSVTVNENDLFPDLDIGMQYKELIIFNLPIFGEHPEESFSLKSSDNHSGAAKPELFVEWTRLSLLNQRGCKARLISDFSAHELSRLLAVTYVNYDCVAGQWLILTE